MTLKRTPLYDQHVQLRALIVPFAGWEMPLHYGSQIKEHNAVRTHAGIFDVSHMSVMDIVGKEANAFLRWVLANDIQKLKANGDALYSCMLNENAGVVDDLIVYRLNPNHYRLVVNAGCREKDAAWLKRFKDKFAVEIHEKTELCILAVQGPEAMTMTQNILPALSTALVQLEPFKALIDHERLIGRTGYTGEDGVEIITTAEDAVALWAQFIAAGVQPCGLGARDTLRLEAGLNLYGNDMDENTSPWITNLGWTISLKDEARQFIGKEVLLQQKQHGIQEKVVGVLLEQQGALRSHQSVWMSNDDTGTITSGGYSPTLGSGIALARVPISVNSEAWIEKRDQKLKVKLVRPPFVRHGKKVFVEI